MNEAVVKPESSFQVSKRGRPTENPIFVEEELQIFTKKPKVIWANSRKKAKNRKEVFDAPNGSNDLDAIPKAETDPGCSYSTEGTSGDIIKYSIKFRIDQSTEYRRPKLNYRQLSFLAMKNANFIPMQTSQICDFIETVFPFFSQGTERSKLLWRNALAGAVRTGKCDEGLFTTSSVCGSGLKMFYGVRTDKIELLEEQISRWRKQFDHQNIKESGVASLDELNMVCNGVKGITFVIQDMGAHVEKWKKSQLSGSTLEDYDAQERQRLQLARAMDPESVQTLGTEEEKEQIRKVKKNAPTPCPICYVKMNAKSFGRHMKIIHHLSQEDLLRHRAEMQSHKTLKKSGNISPTTPCPSCGKHFFSKIMLEAHTRICEGTISSESASQADEEEEESSDEEGMSPYTKEKTGEALPYHGTPSKPLNAVVGHIWQSSSSRAALSRLVFKWSSGGQSLSPKSHPEPLRKSRLFHPEATFTWDTSLWPTYGPGLHYGCPDCQQTELEPVPALAQSLRWPSQY